MPSIPVWTFIEGGLAAALGYRLGLAPWWVPIQAGFVPGLAAMLVLDIPPLWFLAAFTVLVLVYWSTFRTQVPLYFSSRSVRERLCELLPARAGFSFIDLGCGLGGVLAHLGRTRPDGHYQGIEAAPLPYLISWLRARAGAADSHILWGSFWTLDLADYDVVYAYLSPIPMSDLWHKVRTEMRPGSLFISNSFDVADVNPTSMIKADGVGRSRLYVWQV
jgi:SAM-dependent methyltransferase